MMHIYMLLKYFNVFITFEFKDLAWDERGEVVLKFKVKGTWGRNPSMSLSFQLSVFWYMENLSATSFNISSKVTQED